ncbi:MAG: hypothetical protein IKW83_08360 [Muribaculaceae bacterium]|nr:hypothetical protein [Muribaculaceae bacterium]
MKCINCYREIDDGLKFCPKCGFKQPDDREAYEKEHPELAEAISEEEILETLKQVTEVQRTTMSRDEFVESLANDPHHESIVKMVDEGVKTFKLKEKSDQERWIARCSELINNKLGFYPYFVQLLSQQYEMARDLLFNQASYSMDFATATSKEESDEKTSTQAKLKKVVCKQCGFVWTVSLPTTPAPHIFTCPHCLSKVSVEANAAKEQSAQPHEVNGDRPPKFSPRPPKFSPQSPASDETRKKHDELQSKIQAATVFCPICYHRLSPGTRECPFCHQLLDWKGTPNGGMAAISKVDHSAYKQNDENSNSWIMALLICVVLIIMLFFVIRNCDDEKNMTDPGVSASQPTSYEYATSPVPSMADDVMGEEIDEEKAEDTPKAESFIDLNEDGSYHLTGSVGGAKCKMDITIDGNYVSGTYTYIKFGKPIQLDGEKNGNNIILYEIYDDEYTGSLDGYVYGDSFSGTHTHYDTEVESDFSFTAQ